MIELTGEVGEVIILDDSIEITVADVQSNHAKFGITAPNELKIYLKDNLEKIKEYTSPPYG
jgi:carbon storage regulator CsrA